MPPVLAAWLVQHLHFSVAQGPLPALRQHMPCIACHPALQQHLPCLHCGRGVAAEGSCLQAGDHARHVPAVVPGREGPPGRGEPLQVQPSTALPACSPQQLSMCRAEQAQSLVGLMLDPGHLQACCKAALHARASQHDWSDCRGQLPWRPWKSQSIAAAGLHESGPSAGLIRHAMSGQLRAMILVACSCNVRP